MQSSDRGTVVSFLLVSLVIIGGGILLLITRPAPAQITILPPQPTSTPEPSPTPAPITVYITGAVAQPNTTHTLPPQSRVQDGLSAAGGTLPNADLSRVNLAGILRDGDQVHVPLMGESVEVAIPTLSGGTTVYVNSATQAELESLPGIGPAMAQRILDYRQANGRITSLEDFDNIEGVGPAMLDNLRDLVSFE
jgi:competence protein ComEA